MKLEDKVKLKREDKFKLGFVALGLAGAFLVGYGLNKEIEDAQHIGYLFMSIAGAGGALWYKGKELRDYVRNYNERQRRESIKSRKYREK